MSNLGDGATAAGKLAAVIKDLPLWVLLALAIVADVLFFVPVIKGQLPKEFYPWLIVAAVLFNTLAVSRAISLGMHAWGRLRTAAAARRTFHMSPEVTQSFWSMSRQADDTNTTQIAARILVKNLTSTPLGLVGVRLIKPRIRGEIIHAGVIVRAANSNVYGSAVYSGHTIPPQSALPASLDIMIRGVPKQPAEETLHVMLGVTDDEGNEQRMTMPLKGAARTKTPSQSEAAPPLEAVFEIEDPIAKEVAAVLQSEIGRYDKHGRREGGLGSVHVLYQKRIIRGMGGDSWSPDSPKNQSIVADPESATLESDNLDALLSFYARLATEQEKNRFSAALLDRLDGQKGYLKVSYFIVCALWKIGRLRDALTKSVLALPDDERKVFGLSNVLLMFNGLLRYRHPDFTPEMLDQLEHVVHQLKKEHTFRIAEKIAQVRASRLLTPIQTR